VPRRGRRPGVGAVGKNPSATTFVAHRNAHAIYKGLVSSGHSLVVTYAKQEGPHSPDEMDGPGLGFVDVFSNDGRFLHRLASHGALNAPWGVALAPAGFGPFSGGPVVVPGLWGLMFGNGNVVKTNALIFSAGPDGEAHGLLGKLVAP
jgi:hypothetical protein